MVKRSIGCPNYCHIFNFIGCGNVDWLIVKGKNQLDIIVVNENRFDETANKLRLVCTHFRSTRYLHKHVKTTLSVAQYRVSILVLTCKQSNKDLA